MFVMTEIDVNHSAKKPNERFGIVIPESMLQLYIGRWFDDLRNHVVKNGMNDIYKMSSGFRLRLEETRYVGVVQNKNRPLKNFAFGNAVRIYTRKLTTEQIASFIHTSGNSFLNTMFVMTEEDINDSAKNRYEWFGIVIPDNMLQQYIERIFNGLTNESLLVEYIDINRVLNNAKGRTALCTHMKQLTKEKTAALLQNAGYIFFNTMFVMREEDIKDNAKYRYECFGIVIPDDLVQQYIERWFDDLTKTSSVEVVIQENRPLNNVTFRSMLRTFIKQLTTDKICSIIQSANNDFINKMFVMTEDQIRDNADNGYECLGIVIPHVLLQQYIQRWFEDLTKAYLVEDILDKNRLLLNITFYCAVRTYIRQLTTEQIASIIQTTEIDILSTLFVMSENDIKSDAANRLKCLCIVIPDDLVQQYIQRLLYSLKKDRLNVKDINKHIPLMSVKFRSAVRTCMKNLPTDKIASIINEAEESFLNTLFFMTEEDIKDDFSYRQECFGIVIPGDLLQQYIVRWFECLTEPNSLDKFISFDYFKGNDLVENFMELCRPLNNVRFHTALRTYMRQLNTDKIGYLIQTARYDFINTMFVMTEDDINDNSDNQYERFGIVMPNDLLQQYIARWFAGLVKKGMLAKIQHKNRVIKNVTFRIAFQTYLRKISTKKIVAIIQTAKDDFFNAMFVMTEDDIKDYATNRNECFGIVIPDELLQQYIQRLFDDLTKTDSVKDIIDKNRPLLNAQFRSVMRTYMKQLVTKQIDSLINTSGNSFLNTMFVMTEEDINKNAENQNGCFGIVIPDGLLQQYIQRLFDVLKNAYIVKLAVEVNRPLMNVMFRSSVRSYMRQLTTDKIASNTREANDSFLNTMFFMSEEDIRDSVVNRHECFGIVIPDALVQQYIARWFELLTEKSTIENKNSFSENRFVEYIFKRCKYLNNVRFCTALRTHMRKLNTDKIGYLIQTAGYNFINIMFVMTDDDINDNHENQYERFGIVLPNDLLQQYISRWFAGLIKTSMLAEIQNKNRVIKNVTFRIALLTYMRKMNTEQIAALIQIAKDDFFNAMFVMTEVDIKEYATNRNECYGIVIPDELLQEYIQRWFDDLTKTESVKDIIDKNRPLLNAQFRSVMRTYMKQLVTKQIDSLISTAGDSFVNTMFVMTDESIEDEAANLYECFGIVIPDDLLQQYIVRCFECLTKISNFEKQWIAIRFLNKTCLIDNFMKNCRPLNNVRFRAAFRIFMSQLNTEKIGYLIQNAGYGFINSMFVMTDDDVNDNSANKYEYFGIIIPDELLQHFIEKWFKGLHKTKHFKNFIVKNRLLKNVKFRSVLCYYIRKLNSEKIADLIMNANNDFFNTVFVMKKEDLQENTKNHYECLSIVIPDDRLQQYIAKWIELLTKTSQLEKFIEDNRPLRNVAFRTSLCCHMRQLTTGKIVSLIWNAEEKFFNKMFVVTEEDIRDDAENQHERYGIIIPTDLLQQYTERWFNRLTKTRCIKEFMDTCRPLKNITFCSTLCNYMRQLNTEKISSLIQTANNDFINTMFVMLAEDLDDTSKDRYEHFGIVIPDNLLQQYIERWFECLTTTMDFEKYINKNRPMKNVTFCTALRTHMKQLNIEKMWSLIQTANGEFINKMFVVTEDDVKENTEIIYERVRNTENDFMDNTYNRYEYLGCVIPDSLIQKYIEKWLNYVEKSGSAIEYMNYTRPLNNFTFRNELRTYLRQLNTEKIWTLIGNKGRDFLNTMFVMNEEDINDNAEKQYECFGIVIPGDLLNTCIERWLDRTIYKYETDKFSVKEAMAVNRPMRNVAFRSALCSYIKRLSAKKVIHCGRIDFLNTMFVMSESDIKDNARNRYECIGIIIPDGLLEQYIKRWFNGLAQTDCVEEYMNMNRPLNNEICRTQLLTYIRQLDVTKIGTLIQTGSRDFINTMFVMTKEDIKDNAEYRYECFGIVLSDDLLQQYTEKCFDGLTKTDSVKESIDANRCFVNRTFRISLQNYIKQLTLGKIRNLIQTGSRDFVNTMFVITENDIKADSENRLEYFGIILPDNLLYPYIERWFGGMTKTNSAKQYIDGNRTFMNSKFQASLDLFISGINLERIEFFIRKGHIDYLNTRRDLFKENVTSEIKS